MVDIEFTVLLPVYAGDDAEKFSHSLKSIVNQTLKPREILLIADGPLTDELETVISNYKRNHPQEISVLRIPENQGLGNALKTGIKHCSTEVVARMDADDISTPTRFEKQIRFLEANPTVDVVGGYQGEYESSPGDLQWIREVPTEPNEIREYAQFRNPMNHPTVMFKKEPILTVGSYRDYKVMQDYDLWVRLLNNGYVISNISEVLIKSPIDGLFQRRGGLDYLQTEMRLQYSFYQIGFINIWILIFNLLLRMGVRLAPRRFRELLYKKAARK